MANMPGNVEAEFAADLDQYIEEWTDSLREHFNAEEEDVTESIDAAIARKTQELRDTGLDDLDASRQAYKLLRESIEMEAVLIEAGFSGEKKDKLGRRMCFANGKRVACPKAPKPAAEKKASPKKPAAAAKPKRQAKEPNIGNADKGWKEPLKDRLTRIQDAEKGTGIAYMDRVVNGVMAQRFTNNPDHDLYKKSPAENARWAEAYSDIVRRGDQAKPENLSYMKTLRANVRNEILAGGARTETVNALNGISDGGNGKLSHAELLKHGAGTLKARAARKAPAKKQLIPSASELKLQPIAEPKKKLNTGDDYFDSMDAPLNGRMDEIAYRDSVGGTKFKDKVINAYASEDGSDGAKRYRSAMQRIADSRGTPNVADVGIVNQYKANWLKNVDGHDQLQIDGVLKHLHDTNQGTISYGEFVKAVKSKTLEGREWESRGHRIADGRELQRVLLEGDFAA